MLGWSYFQTGKYDDAEAQMRRAVATDPGTCATHANLAIVLQGKGRLEEAAASYTRALELDAGDVQCLLNLGVCKVDQNDLAAGEALVRRALEIDRNRPRTWANLGVALALQHRNEAALEAFENADRIEEQTGEDVENFVNFALHLREAGRTSNALDLYEKHLPLHPSLAGHNDYAFALLTAGRLPEGWNQYEFRWMRAPLLHLRPNFNRPMWSGQDLNGRVILLRAEQGFGDIFQFVRYAPLVKARGATVLIQVREGLERLARSFAGVDQVLDRSKSESLPPFDFYANLPSIPLVFGTDLDSIPVNVPYICADAATAVRWGPKLGGREKPRVGIAWAGSPTHTRDRFRSMSLGMLRPILEVSGVGFVSLQKGAVAETGGAVPVGVDWIDVGPELEDFSDTAAVISQLDLVICVDTAVAHLAGALGKPVWVMVAQPADFRWLEGREDSPWYPTMRLFRQSRRDDWTDVVARVKAALEAQVREGPAVMPAKTSVKAVTSAVLPWTSPAQLKVGHRPGMSAVAETRVGILQYLPDEPIVGDAIGWYGEYLQPQLDLLARIVRPGATMMEVGAGVGAHAVFLGRLLGEAGHLFLYESRPVLQRILRQNLAANGVSNVTVMRRTLGSQGEGEGSEIAMPTTETLDELQLERLDWLKVDASVAALDVLAGASETLWRLRPLLFLAVPDEQGLHGLAERAREFSYRCWRMETALFNPQNFNRRETDIFAGAKATALLAIPEEIDVDIALDKCIEIS
jgi:Tfp pilus assembly protein PilF